MSIRFRPRSLLPLAAVGLAAALGGCVAYPGYGYGYGYGNGYNYPYAYNYGYAAPSVGVTFGNWGGYHRWHRYHDW